MSELQMVQQMCHPTTLVSGCRTHHRLLNLVIDGNHAGTGCAVGETGGEEELPTSLLVLTYRAIQINITTFALSKATNLVQEENQRDIGFPPNAGSPVNNRGVIHTHKHTPTL